MEILEDASRCVALFSTVTSLVFSEESAEVLGVVRRYEEINSIVRQGTIVRVNDFL